MKSLLKKMKSVLKKMKFVLKTMKSVLKKMKSVLKTMKSVLTSSSSSSVLTSSLQKNPSWVGLARYLRRSTGEPMMARMATSISKSIGKAITGLFTSIWRSRNKTALSLLLSFTPSHIQLEQRFKKKVDSQTEGFVSYRSEKGHW